MLYRVQNVKLRKLALKESPRALFNTIDTKEINDRLDDSPADADRESWKPETMVHSSEGRRYATKLYVTSLRELIKAMVAFCWVRKTSNQK